MQNNAYTTANYSIEIEFAKPAGDVFNHVINLSKWWPEEYTGGSIKPDSEFVLGKEGDHYSKNRVIEFMPNKKITWLVTESRRASDNYDWTGTKFIFELESGNGVTLLKFTYDGVVLKDETERLARICDVCIKEMLFNYVNSNDDKSYEVTIEVAKPAQDVFSRIADVPKWWSKDFEGQSTRVNEEFVICHPNRHYSKQRLTEVIPGKKVVWLVTESNLNWIEKNKHEWTNSQMIFEITANGEKTILHFTHKGLTPEKECYAMCAQGWSTVIKERLFNYITNGIAI